MTGEKTLTEPKQAATLILVRPHGYELDTWANHIPNIE
jgi:hypothetical protein